MVLNRVSHTSLASYSLDLIRFIAALIVFLMHFGYGSLGYQAVMVFFVLSGYFVSIGVMEGMTNANWSWKTYLIKRLTRLYIVLIPALLITYIVAKIQIHYFGGADYFAGTLDLKTFFGNLFYLQGIEVERFGFNGPLWSLAYEFWYYILFPIAILAFISKKWITKIIYGLLFVGIITMVGPVIAKYFLVWLIGVAIAYFKPRKFANNAINWIVGLAIVVALYYSLEYSLELMNAGLFKYYDPLLVPDLLIGITFGALVYWIITMFNDITPTINLNALKKLAGFSYTLYLVHYPFKYFWLAWIRSPYWMLGSTYIEQIKWLYVILVVIFCYLLAKVTEEKTGKVVKWLMKRFA